MRKIGRSIERKLYDILSLNSVFLGLIAVPFAIWSAHDTRMDMQHNRLDNAVTGEEIMSLATVVSIPSVLPHKNADKLEIIPLRDRQFITAKGQFHPGDKGVLIALGAVVPPTAPFKWIWEDGLAYRQRVIKARRLRGEWSSGLLMTPSELGLDISEIVEGTDLSDLIGVHEDYEDIFTGWPVKQRKPKCHRNHMPRSLKGWVRYIRYRVIG